jgi:hypothetical protein
MKTIRVTIMMGLLCISAQMLYAQKCTEPTNLVPCAGSLQPKIMIHEFTRQNGNLETEEFVEFLFLEDMTPAELNNYAFGDSDSFRNNKLGIYKFQNTEQLIYDKGITVFYKGTLLVVAGPTNPNGIVHDTSYHPKEGDWNMSFIITNPTYITRLSSVAGDVTQKVVFWIDDTTKPGYSNTTISDYGFGLSWGGGTPGTLDASAAVVGIGTPGSGKSMQLISCWPNRCDPKAWCDAQPATPGDANYISPDTNTDYSCLNSIWTGPLLVDLDYLRASAPEIGGGVLVEWATAAEFSNAGFLVYRAREAAPGVYVPHARLTEQLIPARGDEMSGATYYFVDSDPVATGEVRAYFLEDIDLAGVVTRHGPAIVQAPERMAPPPPAPIASPTPTVTPVSPASPEPSFFVDSDGDRYSDAYEVLVGTNPQDANSKPSLGDVNGDGKADVADAIALYRMVQAGEALSAEQAARADVNRDGVVNLQDAIILYRWATGDPGFALLPHQP